jgi:hypothetical protein
MLPHIENHIKHPELVNDSTLYVIGVISNPVRYHSRYRIAREWVRQMAVTPNVKLILVEAAYGDRHHELAHADVGLQCEQYDHVKLRTHSEAWIKEGMINIGMRHAVARYDAQYLAWIDADVFFPRIADDQPNRWALETIHQLQVYEVVQPWQTVADLGPHGETMQSFKSFGFQHQRRVKKQTHPTQPYEYSHTGMAWACTRSFYEAVNGKLMDFPILGSADHHMAFAMINEVNKTIHAGMQPSFFRRCYEWQAKAFEACSGEVGFTPGGIVHWFHGPKGRRYYRERWQLLVDAKYDPDTQLRYDRQGLATLVHNHKLEHMIKLYNRSRFEDSIEPN